MAAVPPLSGMGEAMDCNFAGTTGMFFALSCPALAT
jgi:hypothetical protein